MTHANVYILFFNKKGTFNFSILYMTKGSAHNVKVLP